jgi:hypothetical protein
VSAVVLSVTVGRYACLSWQLPPFPEPRSDRSKPIATDRSGQVRAKWDTLAARLSRARSAATAAGSAHGQ